MTSVLIRQKMQSGDDKLLRANVISRQGDTLRVVMEGDRTRKPIEVKASEVLDQSTVFVGGVRHGERRSIIQKVPPPSANALGNLKRF